MLNAEQKQLLAVCRQVSLAARTLGALPSGSEIPAVWNALKRAAPAQESIAAALAQTSNAAVESLLGITLNHTVVDFGETFVFEDTNTSKVLVRAGTLPDLPDMENPDAPIKLQLEVTLHAPGTSRHGRWELLSVVFGPDTAFKVVGQA